MQQIKKVLCFGELLLRMSPSADTSWIKETSMPVYIGGAELNAAQALAKWGIPVRYCTALPANSLSETLTTYLSDKGVDTSAIQYQGDRVGLYYMPHGADLKNAGVIYDRSHSSFAELKTGMIDWDKVLDGIDWFHFSAIIPAISNDLADVCEEALQAAAAKNITISVDLNYRAKLWKYGKAPGEIMPRLAKYCDVIMGNIWAEEHMLNIPVDQTLVDKNEQESFLQHTLQTSQAIQQQYPKCTTVANTFRFTGSNEQEINYYAAFYTDGVLHHSGTYSSSAIVDKAGTGDCFMAGLIYSACKQFTPQETIDFAAAAAFSKFFIPGDATNISVHEIEKNIKR